MRNFEKKADNWYDRHGVKRPEQNPHLTEDQIADIFDTMRAKTRHGQWKLQGNYLTCNACPNPHGDHIDPAYLLYGTDENGLPILKKRGNITS